MNNKPSPAIELQQARYVYDLVNTNNPQSVANALKRLKAAQIRYDYGV